MKVPSFLLGLIHTDPHVDAIVTGAVSRFGDLIGKSQMPLFQEYTDHSLDHVEDVLRTAVDLSTEKAKALVSATDAAVLVLAVCLHDAAMHLTEDGFLSLVRAGSRWRPVDGFEDRPWDVLWQDFQGEARRFDGRKLLALFGDTEPIRRLPERVTDLTKRDRQLMGEFIRRHHARLAHEIALHGIPGPDGTTAPLISQTSDLGRWLADLGGVTARSHGTSVRIALGYLQKRYHTREFNGIHAVFLMVLVRIADYLQIQARRAPIEVLEIRKLSSPISQGEWKMHAAIRNITCADDDPEALQIDARPLDVMSYLRVQKWLSGIQGELDTSWAVLGEVYGRYAREGLDGLTVGLRRVRSNLDNIEQFANTVDYVPAQTSFEAANPDLLKLLVGPLYSDRPEVGLRELVQNAVDSVREVNDFLSRRSDLASAASREQQADVQILVNCERDLIDRDSFTPTSLVISDRGMGMTLDVIQNYFLKAGASFRRSDAWRQQFENDAGRSNVLRSGRFGVGALAAFLIGDRIEVTSRHIESAPDRGISFCASLDDEAVSLKWVACATGTSIVIPIAPNKRKKVQKAFGLLHLNGKRELRHHSGLSQYLSAQPSTTRIIQVSSEPAFTLSVKDIVPTEGEIVTAPWRSFKTKDYSGVFWTYDSNFPSLTCNGIPIVKEGTSLDLLQIDKSFLLPPRVSIFDRDGKLPLNLQRTSLTTHDLDLSSALLDDVLDDLLAYAIVDGPTDMGSRQSLQWLRGKYEGFGRFQFRPYLPHRWFVAQAGFGLVDPTLAFTGDVSALLIAYPLTGLKKGNRVELNDYLKEVIGHLGCDLRLMFSEGLSLNGINDVKLMARSLLAEWSFQEILPYALRTWKNIGRRVFLRKPLVESFRANATFGRMLRSIVSHAKVEVANDDWLVFRYGMSPPHQVLRLDSQVLLQAKETDIAAIVECYPNGFTSSSSIVADRWLRVLGVPLIPFDEAVRKTLCSSVNAELSSHVDLWRENVANSRMKGRDDLTRAEEASDIDPDVGIDSAWA